MVNIRITEDNQASYTALLTIVAVAGIAGIMYITVMYPLILFTISFGTVFLIALASVVTGIAAQIHTRLGNIKEKQDAHKS